MVPVAPGRFSTTSGWPSCSPMAGAISRVTVSIAPPGGKDTMTRIGLVGQAGCARAGAASGPGRAAAAASSAARRVGAKVMREVSRWAGLVPAKPPAG